jgi:tetratricopeptide (TPR) repeat protein
MAPQVLEDILVQRHELAADLVDRIIISITTDNKHYPLLIGARGMGLVSIVYNRIKQREDLQDLVMIGWLREEEWGISSWLDLVVRIFRSISEEYPNTETAAIAINNITILQTHSPTEAEVLAESLLAELVGKKTLFLIIENLDDVFDGLGTNGQQRLRSFLQEYKCCTILATTPVLFNGITSRNEAFYGWFTPFHLQPFTHTDAIELLTNIATQSGDQELASFLRTPAGSARVRAVHRLAGGNPRGYTLFAQLITKQDLDSLVGTFMKMLDDLYRGKEVESLVEMIRIWYRPEEIKAQFDRLMLLGNEEHAHYYKHAMEDSRPHPMLLACNRDFQKSLDRGDAQSALQVWQELAHVQNISVDRSQPIADLIVAEKFDEARGAIRDLLDIEQKSQDSIQVETIEELYLQGVLLYKAEDWDAALSVFDHCLQHNPQNDKFLFMHGNTLGKLGRLDEAIISYDKALKVNPDIHQAWYNRGNDLGDLGRLDEAITSYDEALKIKPDYDKAWNNRGTSLVSLGRLDEAIASFDQALKINTDNDEAWNNRGVALSKLGRLDEAITSYDKALEINPDFHQAWSNRGDDLGDLGCLDEAITSYDKALKINPDYFEAWHNKGGTFYDFGNYQNALDAFQQAISIKPGAYNSCHNRGFIFFQLGNYAEALDAWRSAFKIIHDLQPSDTSKLIQELLDGQLLAKFQQPTVRDLIPQLLEIYIEAEVLPELGVALTRNIKALISPIISEYTANEWLKLWQKLGKPHPELGLALKMVAAGVKHKKNPQDKRIFLALPQELRPLMQEALGIEQHPNP